MKATFLHRAACAAASLLCVGIASAAPQPERAQDTAVFNTVYSFNGNDGLGTGSLILGADGNLYGTTYNGGIGYGVSSGPIGPGTPPSTPPSVVPGNAVTGCGTFYRLTPSGEYTLLYAFTGGGDGAVPGMLVQGIDGNFYGTTSKGGAASRGTLFRITPAGVLTTLYTFTDVVFPSGPLVQGSDGSLYGATASFGGDYGTVFRYTPAGEFVIVHRFNGTDGNSPSALVIGRDGNLYGTTRFPTLAQPDGSRYFGTAFRLTPGGELTFLHGFTNGPEGDIPNSLVQAGDGNFYGACSAGGPAGYNYGTVFRMTPEGQVTLVHAFAAGSEGVYPYQLILGNDGDLYGATMNSISATQTASLATVFRMGLDGTVTTLYGTTSSVGVSVGALVQERAGNLFGTNSLGIYGKGSVFEWKVVSHPKFFARQMPVGSDVFYLGLTDLSYFGFYTFLSDPNYLYHYDMGFEYLFDAKDGNDGVYLYDFASGGFFYTSRTFPFPYMYDFNLKTFVYYFPDPNTPGRYNTNGVRYFYQFDTGTIISK